MSLSNKDIEQMLNAPSYEEQISEKEKESEYNPYEHLLEIAQVIGCLYWSGLAK